MQTAPYPRPSLRFWETCSNQEKLVLLTGLRYAVSLSLLALLGYAVLYQWRIEHLVIVPSGLHLTWISSPVQRPEAILIIVLSILLYNTIAAFVMGRVAIIQLAVALSILDLITAIAGIAVTLPKSPSSFFSEFFAIMLLTYLLFLGFPMLSVFFGRKTAFFTIGFFFIAEAYLHLAVPLANAQVPVIAVFAPMAFFTVLTYIIGHMSEVEQTYEQKAETLGLLEKSLRLEREALVSELERANELKRQVLAFATHELRTPLHAMKGYISSLLDGMSGSLNTGQRDDVKKIMTNSDYLLSLINDLLDLTRIETGKLEFNPEEVSVQACLQDALDMVAQTLKERKLSLATDIPSDLPTIKADYVRLKQILLNLIWNALKFTDSGGIAISAHSDKDILTIEVCDTGRGIPSELLPHVFEEHWQLYAPTSRRFGGSGLGLTIAKRLAELHKGRIEVESILGKGSCFRIILPLESTDPSFS